jgi:hypothetical protein
MIRLASKTRFFSKLLEVVFLHNLSFVVSFSPSNRIGRFAKMEDYMRRGFPKYVCHITANTVKLEADPIVCISEWDVLRECHQLPGKPLDQIKDTQVIDDFLQQSYLTSAKKPKWVVCMTDGRDEMLRTRLLCMAVRKMVAHKCDLQKVRRHPLESFLEWLHGGRSVLRFDMQRACWIWHVFQLDLESLWIGSETRLRVTFLRISVVSPLNVGS